MQDFFEKLKTESPQSEQVARGGTVNLTIYLPHYVGSEDVTPKRELTYVLSSTDQYIIILHTFFMETSVCMYKCAFDCT